MACQPEDDLPAVSEPQDAAHPVAAEPVSSTASLWWEVVAVLAVSVLPWLWNAIVMRLSERHPRLYWLDALSLTFSSGFISFVVLYLIHRSGEKWKVFGLVRPGIADLGVGAVLFIASAWMWRILGPMLPDEIESHELLFPRLRGGLDYALMVVQHLANGFTEELIVRAYLITRLERLLGSRTQAVFLAALTFASYHLYYGPGGALVGIFCLGLVFGGLYLIVRRVWGFALAHALMNVFIDMASATGSGE